MYQRHLCCRAGQRARPAWPAAPGGLCYIGAYEAQPPTVGAHTDVTATATSAAGAVVSYTPPAGTDEQGGTATMACLPASGSTFAVGSTTVTCTATDAVGHSGTGTFDVIVAGLPATPTPTPSSSSAALPDTAASDGNPWPLASVLTIVLADAGPGPPRSGRTSEAVGDRPAVSSGIGAAVNPGK